MITVLKELTSTLGAIVAIASIAWLLIVIAAILQVPA